MLPYTALTRSTIKTAIQRHVGIRHISTIPKFSAKARQVAANASKSWRTIEATLCKHPHLLMSTGAISAGIGFGIGIISLNTYQRFVSSYHDPSTHYTHENGTERRRVPARIGVYRGMKVAYWSEQKKVDGSWVDVLYRLENGRWVDVTAGDD